MTNGEKFKEIFQISQFDEGVLYAYVWLPNHDAAEFCIDWWNAEYEESTTKNDLGVDCISRSDVLKLMKDNWHTHNGDWAMQESMDDIRALPSVTPQEPRKGEWCPQNDDYFDWYECSECGYGSEGEMQYSSEHDVRTNYCPNCGAKMDEPQESEG